MKWSFLLRHNDTMRVSWLGLRPRVEVFLWRGGRVVYKPKCSGRLSIGALTEQGRVICFERAA